MKILFTGGSSFTGFWFIKELIAEGHEVVATFTVPDIDSYEGIRKKRVELIKDKVKSYWNTKFGDELFIKILKAENNIDLFCHHASDVVNYKSENFDIAKALSNNTRNLSSVLEIIKKNGCNGILLTGSVFEGNEGTGSDDLIAFSPYGLSKQLTLEMFKYYCRKKEFKLAKFVIPNPFGPYEEQRFTNYLVTTWIKGGIPVIKTPLYVRDNIHVSLLANTYAKFAKEIINNDGNYIKINPSGYIESMEEFTKRFSVEISKRVKINCLYEIENQVEFIEPLKRFNTFPALQYVGNWNESKAWDELADFYQQQIIDINK